jgi:hypothetical protein
MNISSNLPDRTFVALAADSIICLILKSRLLYSLKLVDAKF